MVIMFYEVGRFLKFLNKYGVTLPTNVAFILGSCAVASPLVWIFLVRFGVNLLMGCSIIRLGRPF